MIASSAGLKKMASGPPEQRCGRAALSEPFRTVPVNYHSTGTQETCRQSLSTDLTPRALSTPVRESSSSAS